MVEDQARSREVVDERCELARADVNEDVSFRVESSDRFRFFLIDVVDDTQVVVDALASKDIEHDGSAREPVSIEVTYDLYAIGVGTGLSDEGFRSSVRCEELVAPIGSGEEFGIYDSHHRA
jgi:hypothetical protein